MGADNCNSASAFVRNKIAALNRNCRGFFRSQLVRSFFSAYASAGDGLVEPARPLCRVDRALWNFVDGIQFAYARCKTILENPRPRGETSRYPETDFTNDSKTPISLRSFSRGMA